MFDNENKQYSNENDKFTTFNKKSCPPGFENIVRMNININVLDNRRLSWYIEIFKHIMNDHIAGYNLTHNLSIGIPLKTKL